MKKNGFTLVELMVVVAILGIISAVAYPSYVSKMRESRRSDAKVALATAAQNMERVFTEKGGYNSATLGSTGIYPSTSPNGYYTIAFGTGQPTSSTFSLTATPTGKQASDVCGTFQIDQTGAKSNSGGSQTTNCW